MNLSLDDMTIYNKKVADKLFKYLSNVSAYDNFDDNMNVRVYVDSFKDFTAFEAISYKLGFTSNDHKLLETITSKYVPIVTDFQTFYNRVAALQF